MGIPIPQEPKTNIRFGLDSLRIQTPGKDRRARRNYSLSYNEYFNEFIRFELLGMIALDTEKKSRSVDIRQDYYGLFPGASLVYHNLFRYSTTIGLGLWHQQTTSKIINDSEWHSTYSFALLNRYNMDYAITEAIELGLYLGFYYRFEYDMLDWSYGLSINYNLDFQLQE